MTNYHPNPLQSAFIRGPCLNQLHFVSVHVFVVPSAALHNVHNCITDFSCITPTLPLTYGETSRPSK